MKIGDVKAKTNDELKQTIAELRKEAFNLRFQRASGQLENTSRIRRVRRDIAQVKTVVRQRKGAAAASGAGE